MQLFTIVKYLNYCFLKNSEGNLTIFDLTITIVSYKKSRIKLLMKIKDLKIESKIVNANKGFKD
jgi:hypothetical protein